jgi:hypothetical protein
MAAGAGLTVFPQPCGFYIAFIARNLVYQHNSVCAQCRRVRHLILHLASRAPCGRGFFMPCSDSGGASTVPLIIRDGEGYDIYVDGQRRTFRDVEATAYAAARFLNINSRYKDKVEVVVRATGQRIQMDGLAF